MELPFGINEKNLQFTKVYEIKKVEEGLQSLAMDNSNAFKIKKAFLSPIVRELANVDMINQSLQVAVDYKNIDIIKTLIEISEKYSFPLSIAHIELSYNKALCNEFEKAIDYFDNKYSIMNNALKVAPTAYPNHPDYYESNSFLHAIDNLPNPEPFLHKIFNLGMNINPELISEAFIRYCTNHDNVNVFIEHAEIRKIIKDSDSVSEYLHSNNIYEHVIKKIEMIDLKEKLESNLPLKEGDNIKPKM